MRYVLRLFTGRCTKCGQRSKRYQTESERAHEINNRATRLAVELGRNPQAQSCHKCGRIVFEGEPGFVERYLLVDIV